MNFLAHIYLSEGDHDITIGNFIADGVKGKQFEQYRERVAKGILLHRFIDDFTDTHPIVEVSKARIREHYRKYAGVVIDMFYDHFLATNWSRYHAKALPTFAAETYALLLNDIESYPNKIQYMLPYMARQNWLLSYAEIEGIGKALSGLSRRTTFVSNMENATQHLREYYQDFEADFSAFFPELEAATKQKLVELDLPA